MARKLWVVLSIAILVLALIIGCAKDIIVKPPSTLVGNYHGKTTVLKNYGSSNPGPKREQWIQWTFSDYKFWMKAEKTDLLIQVFCDVSGSYTTTDKINLENVVRGDIFICDSTDYPRGTFTLLRQGDTISISGPMGTGTTISYLEVKIVKE